MRIDLTVSDKVAVCVENIFQSGEGFVFFAQLDVRNRQCIGIRLLLFELTHERVLVTLPTTFRKTVPLRRSQFRVILQFAGFRTLFDRARIIALQSIEYGKLVVEKRKTWI